VCLHGATRQHGSPAYWSCEMQVRSLVSMSYLWLLN